MSFLASGYNAGLESGGSTNTRFNTLVPPMKNFSTFLTALIYTTGNTANTVTIMRPLNSTTVTVAMAANTASASLTVAADPGVYSTAKGNPFQVADNPIASGDLVVIELADGTFFKDLCAAGTTSPAVVLTTTLPVNIGIAAGAKLWFYGAVGDKNPADGLAHPKITTVLNTVSQSLLGGITGNAEGMGIGSYSHYEPLIIDSNNATGTSTLNQFNAVYVNRTGPYKSVNGVI